MVECSHFSFIKCPIDTHDRASAKFSTNSPETDNSVFCYRAPDMVLMPVLLQGPLMRLQMEAYLDDNPEFTESYVIRKVGRKTIEKWLQLHTGQSPIKEN
jgi:hypothetical protein